MTESTNPPAGAGIRLNWLGQAGFCFVTAAGKRIYLDPYLSDACERLARSS
jgi:L-ascorbate metabolism protein UlaG (beta-lactamase superfamily)